MKLNSYMPVKLVTGAGCVKENAKELAKLGKSCLIVTGKTSDLLGASSALLLNALKALGGIRDELHLISPVVIDPIQHLKVDHLGNRNPRLHTDEVLIALSICAATNPLAEMAMEQLSKLRGCEVHSSVILSQVDVQTFKRLGVNLTCQPQYKG